MDAAAAAPHRRHATELHQPAGDPLPDRIGLGLPSPLETGFLLDRLTGLPYLPGSSLKGVARAAALEACEGEEGELRAFWQSNLERVFRPPIDDGSAQGTVAFYDGFPLEPRLEVDVLTPHYGDYYRDPTQPPADWGQPNPVAFLALAAGVEKRFFLAPAGPDLRRQACDLDRALEILENGLCTLGVGGKRSSGCGWCGKERPDQSSSSPARTYATPADSQSCAR